MFNENYHESNEFLSNIQLNNLIVNPLHPCLEEGTIPYDNFQLPASQIKTENKIDKVLRTMLNTIISPILLHSK